MERVPAVISVVFMATTFVTVGIFLFAVRSLRANPAWGRALIFLVPFWQLFQFAAASGGFYLFTASTPPRLFVFGVAPSLLVIALLFAFAREAVVSRLSLVALAVIHLVRIPVELTLASLSDASVVPTMMTYHGSNFDIISGLTAPFAIYCSFRPVGVRRYGLVFWNLFALALLTNIVATAVLSLPSPIQRLAFDQPNVAVLHFPFIWLPTLIVPVVLFSHLASLYQLFLGKAD